MSYKKMSHSELVQACLTGDEDAWNEFKARYNQTIKSAVYRTARRWGNTSKELLEDLIGNAYLKLCNNDYAILRNFEFRTDGEFFGYLRKIATNVVHDYFRSIKPEPSIEDVYQSGDPSIPEGPECIERNVLIKEVEQILFEVTGPDGERDRTIFWLYHRQGFTAKEIAAFFPGQLTVKGVESVIHRVTKEVRERLTDEDKDRD